MATKETIRLVAMSNYVNGTTSFTLHLADALRKIRHPVRIIRPSGKTWGKPRRYHTDECELMRVEDIIAEGQVPTIMTGFVAKGLDEETDAITEASDAVVTVHAMMEINRFKHSKGRRPVAVRPSLQPHVPDSIYIPLPYTRYNFMKPGGKPGEPWSKRSMHAVSISRVAKDKNTDMLLLANRALPVAQEIKIFGKEDRMYSYHVLEKRFNEWHCGHTETFTNGTGAVVCANARFMVDMTAVAGDGGGAQYSFFEAWDGGAIPVAHQDWCDGITMRPNDNCIAVSSVDGIVQAVARRRLTSSLSEIRTNGVLYLETEHDPYTIARRYVRRLGL